jgi:hypothetical protein
LIQKKIKEQIFDSKKNQRTKCPPHNTLTTPRRTADRHLLG